MSSQTGSGSILVRIISELSLAITYIGAAVLGMLILFVAWDVFARYILNKPTKGDFELIVLATGVIAAFGLADALVHDRHIRIDILTLHFPRRVRRILDVCTHLFGFALWAVLAWRATIYGVTVKKAHSITGMLPIPVYPFVFLVAFGCAVLCLAFLSKLILSLFEVVKKDDP